MRTPSPQYVLFQLIHKLGFTPAQIEQIAQNDNQQTGKMWHSANHTLVVDRQILLIEQSVTPAELTRTMLLPEVGTYVFSQNVRLRITKCTKTETFRPSKLAHCVHLDASNIVFPLVLRHIKTADRFVPFGMKSSKLVSDFLTDRKRSYFDKQRQLALFDKSGALIWLVGERTDNRFRVNENTNEVLQLECLLS